MTGYLDNYGAGDEKRERIVRRVLLWTVAALAVAGVLYFVFHFVFPTGAKRPR